MTLENMHQQEQETDLSPVDAPISSKRHSSRTWCVLRSMVIGILAIAVLIVSASSLNQNYLLKDWLAWTLATIWGWQILLAATVAITGHALVVRVLRIRCSSALELLALAVPVGTVAFTMGIFVAGFLGLLGSIFAVVWPVLLLILSLLSTRNLGDDSLAQFVRQLRPARSLGMMGLVATLFGLLAVGIVYLKIFSPDVIGYDAAWTHLVIAQDYAREGRIVPFFADWPKNLPHLGSVINTWSFLVPGLDVPATKYMMSLHTEFVFFLWTLVGVSAGIEKLGARSSGAWSAVFLFPAIFVYDHNLAGGADHFLAFFAVPVFLAVLGTVQTFELRWWALLAVVAAGTVLTKFQAVLLIAPAIVVLAVAIVIALIRRWRQRESIVQLWLGPLLAAGIAFVLTAPHFVKNIICYRNPIYPFGQQIFTGSKPTVPDAAIFADKMLKHWGMHPYTALEPWLRRLFEAVTIFPCQPPAPESGALFAASLLLAPFLPRARRLHFALLFCLGTLITWNLTYIQGRNLEAVLPLLAAATGATLIHAYRIGLIAKVAVGALVLFQVIAGFDNLFANPESIAHAVSLIRSGREGHAHGRFDDYQRHFIALGNSLPKDAIVLMHSEHIQLGINRTILHDWLGFQSLIDHRQFKTSRDIYTRLKELGVTHIAYQPGVHTAETRQADAVFAAFFARYRNNIQSFGPLRLLAMPSDPPPLESPYEVLLTDMSEQPDGLYAIADLDGWEEFPHDLFHRKPPLARLTSDSQAALISRAQVVLLGRNSSMNPEGRQMLSEKFDSIVSYNDYSVLVRRP
jgi:hypothetical protein